MIDTFQDIRFAIRQLRRSASITFLTVLTLSLGIGASTAVFSVIDAVLLRPLPFAHQDRLVFPNTVALEGYPQPWSYLSYLDARGRLNSFQDFAGYSDYTKLNLESPAGPVSLRAVTGTDNFFDVFGVRPVLGRTFLPGEDQPGRNNLAVLSYEVWQQDFGRQRDVIGKTVRLDGAPYIVIGVMPASFRFPLSARNAIYTPLHPEMEDPNWKTHRGSHWLKTVALLKAGVNREQAQGELRRVLTDIGHAYPDSDGGRSATLIPLRDQITGQKGAPLITLLLAVLALLAIACVDVAGLLLARGIKRSREFALRSAVGAARGRLIRQMLTEGLVLSFAGWVCGALLSVALLSAMRVFLISAFARGAEAGLNVPVLLAALVLSTLTGLAASLLPALRVAGVSPNTILRAGGSAGTSRDQHRLRSAFVITQVGLSLVLLVTAGLLMKRLQGLLHRDLGFDPKAILTVPVNLSRGNYANQDPLVTFYEPLLSRVEHLPGVEAAGMINLVPVQSWGSNSDVHIAGQPPYPPQQEMLAETRYVSSGYFEAMGIRFLHGRALSAALDPWQNPAGSVVVNEAFQHKFFPSGGDPVGARIDDSDKAELKTGIVGVTTNVSQDVNQPPLAEMDWLVDELNPKNRLDNLANMSLIVRSSENPQQLIPTIREAMHEVDPSVPFLAPATMQEIVSDSLVFERMENWLFGVFAGLALLLALVGLYGLTAHEVELQTRDIGVRMALGSSRGRVMLEVIRRVSILLTAGLAFGWSLTLACRKILASVITWNATHDVALLVTLTGLLGAVGLLASLPAARRAASIDPLRALRLE